MNLMKRHLLILLALAAGFVAKGQDTASHVEFEISSGLTHWYNYPALGRDGVATAASLTVPTSALGIHWRRNDISLGLRYSYSQIKMESAEARLHDFGFSARYHVPIAPRFEYFAGATIGLAMLHHVADSVVASSNAFGLSSAIESGIRCYLNDYISLDLHVSVETLALAREGIMGAGFAAGLSIGIPPKKKTLNMPAELIRHDKPLDLACYDR